MNSKVEMVGNVILDMSYYKGIDEYSDGTVEDDILRIVKETNDYEKEIIKSKDFATFYHLSKEREFITSAMEIKASDNVLEIGSGCGAITGAMSEYALSVDCIELSKKRSLINAYRHKECNNIRIYVGNYEDIVIKKKYDLITLIGVFEYASYYIHADKPFHTFLLNIKESLASNGKIYIAIENRLGAKYLAGCKEDHEGKINVGLEGYLGNVRTRTFSYFELVRIIEECGFSKYRFYYPCPDYKFPMEIYSDDFLPQKGQVAFKGCNYSSERIENFDEKLFVNSLYMEKEYKLFANSFLVCIEK